jgi:hypothetical protein
MTKKCTKCKEDKEFDKFYNSKRHKDGYSSSCKVCEELRHKTPQYIIYRKARYEKHKDRLKASVKANYIKHKSAYQKSSKKYYQSNKSKYVEAGWKQKGILDKYGRYFTLEDYNHVLELQGGLCAICKSDGTSHKKGLVVDHDHKTGVYRGILCAFCNTALSYFKDSPEILNNALNYLK